MMNDTTLRQIAAVKAMVNSSRLTTNKMAAATSQIDDAGIYFRWGAYIGPEYEGANMPLMGPIPEGRTFFCPHCGALYSVTHSRLSKSDSNVAKCVVCLQIMDKWDSIKIPIYKLMQRPEDA